MVGIDKLRFDNGKMTQAELAKKLDVSPTTISKWEKNPLMIGGRNLKRLSIMFNVSVDELLGVETKGEDSNFFTANMN